MRALVVGCGGQDGAYLSRRLEAAGAEVFGLARDGLYSEGARAGEGVDLAQPDAVRGLIARIEPDRIYHLAAHHHSSEETPEDEALLFRRSFAVHVDALLALLEAIRCERPNCRLFYAASSLIFGAPATSPQNEQTAIAPICAYGITKAAGLHLCRYYRRTHGLFCSAGILYTHESPRRGPQFLSRRIVQTAIAIKGGTADELVIGDLDAVVDWGWAPDYVAAMEQILELDAPGDFIVATGRGTRVRDFVTAVFDTLGLAPGDAVREDPDRIVRDLRTMPLIGDYASLSAATGWRPSHQIGDIARMMVAAEQGE